MATRSESHFGRGLLLAAVAVLSFGVLAVVPRWLFSEATFTVIGVGCLLFALLLAISGARGMQGLASAKAYLRLALVVWWSLLVSEEIFYRHPDQEEAFAGHFAGAAYGEAAFWGLAFLALLLMPGPQYLRQALSGCNKWLWLYALLCLISAPFSPTPLYSLAWAFKLTLVAFLLLLCSETMHDLDDIEAFLWSSFWGMLVLAVAPFARTFAQPSTAFEGGRLNELASPTGAAAYAGTLVLLALVLHSLRKRAWLLGLAIVGATLMIMTGGKAGIAAGIASVALFYVLQRRRGAALAWLVGVFALGSVIFALTPLPTYFITYQERGHVFTLTGRTEVWKAVWLEVLEHPIVGHGYVASRLLSIEMGGRYVTELGHAHNGFLDTLYNNGLIGLTILVVIHLAIVRNLWRASKAPPNRKANLLTIGSWAMYLNLLIAGLFNSTFGGAARPPFMLLLGLVVVSEVLRRNARHPTRTAG